MRCRWESTLGQCQTGTDRAFYVNGVPGGVWPCCGRHGKRMMRALMAMFPGHGLYTRKER